MATTRAARKNAYFDHRYPNTDSPDNPNTTADYHLLALLIILSLDLRTREATFPSDGTVDTTKLFQDYGDVIDVNRVTPAHLRDLAPYSAAFAGVRDAWAAFDEYNPEPCPKTEAVKALVLRTQTLPGSLSPL